MRASKQARCAAHRPPAQPQLTAELERLLLITGCVQQGEGRYTVNADIRIQFPPGTSTALNGAESISDACVLAHKTVGREAV